MTEQYAFYKVTSKLKLNTVKNNFVKKIALF